MKGMRCVHVFNININFANNRNDSPQQSFGFLSPTSEKEKVIEAVEEVCS